MFQWMEAMVQLLDESTVIAIAPSIMSPITRELSDSNHLEAKLKQIVIRLGNVLKSKIGIDKYDNICIHMQSKIHEKRTARLRAIATAKIINPVQAVKRRMAINQKKKDAKKQKLETMRTIGMKSAGNTAKSKRRCIDNLFKN